MVKINFKSLLISLSLVSMQTLLCITVCIARGIESKIDEYISACVKTGIFSGSVLVAINEDIIVNKGYGMANYELDIPNTPQTKFRIGSITKPFTAMAIMQLQEKGLLIVEDSIKKYLSDYPEGDKITIHHLLTQTSGVPDFTDSPEYKQMQMIPTTIENTIEMFKNKPLEYTPGEKYKYSNSGYVLLSYIIEKVSGKSFEAFLQENIIQPSNMTRTGVVHQNTITKDLASGYALIDDTLTHAVSFGLTFAAGAFGLYSTVEDIYLWDLAYTHEKLVSRSSLKKMFTPFKDDYGYGWFTNPIAYRKCLNHEGSVNGFASCYIRFVEDCVCIIILSNFEQAPVKNISKDVVAIIFGEKYDIPIVRIPKKVDPKIYDAFVGKFMLDLDFIIAITKENERLFTQATGQPKYEIFPESETKFFFKVVDAQITFVKNEKGEVIELILHQFGKDHTARKIE